MGRGMRPGEPRPRAGTSLHSGATEGVLLAQGDDGWTTTPLGWGTYLRSFGYDRAGKMYGMLFLAGDAYSTTVVEFHER